MTHLFPPLLPKEALRPPVLALAAHPDDEVIACGAMLAWHRAQGHPVTVVHATDGAAGDPDGRFGGDVAATRRREGREALARLGVGDVRFLELRDGELPEQRAELEVRLRALFAETAPRTLYSFAFTESHRDHRALASTVAAVADALVPECRVLLFGVNQPVAGGTLFDVTSFATVKQHALAAYESQLAYNDWKVKILHRDHAATVNVEDPAVQYAELFVDCAPQHLARLQSLCDPYYRYLLGERP